MKREQCAHCVYWHLLTDEPVEGYCRRFPPTLPSGRHAQYPLVGGCQVVCAEFKRRGKQFTYLNEER